MRVGVGGRQPAELAAEHRPELLGLLVRGVVVDQYAQLPAALMHELRGVGHGHQRPA